MSHLSSSPPPEPKPVDGGSGTAGVALPVAAQRVSGASFSGSCATGKKRGGAAKVYHKLTDLYSFFCFPPRPISGEALRAHVQGRSIALSPHGIDGPAKPRAYLRDRRDVRIYGRADVWKRHVLLCPLQAIELL